MSEPKERLIESLTIEISAYDSGRITWSIDSEVNDTPDVTTVREMLMELAEYNAADFGDCILTSVLFHKKGTISVRWPKDFQPEKFREFMWLKSQLYQTLWSMLKRPKAPGWRNWLWLAQWFWLKITGQLKPSQNTATVTATPVAQVNGNTISEWSEGSEISSDSKVVPISNAKRQHDSRPL